MANRKTIRRGKLPKSSSFLPGMRTNMLFGTSTVPVEIIEDRGTVGTAGRRLFRVRFAGAADPLDESFEVAEEDLSLKKPIAAHLSRH
jgi:hypothetical protein